MAAQNDSSIARYQDFIRNSSEGIWRCELDTPIPINLKPNKQIELMFERAYMAEANPAMAKMYGFRSEKSLIGLRLRELMVEDDPRNIAYLTAFIESNYTLAGVDSHERDSKGHDKYFRNSLVGVIENGHVVRAWGTQQDITQQYQAEQALRASEERLALALEASQLGMWEWNVITDELTWSDQLKRLFGLPLRTKVTYEKYLSILHPEDRAEMQKVIKSAMKSGKKYKHEHRVIWPDGSVHWILGQGEAFLKNGKPVRMVGTSQNIDDRKATEAKLQESEERFRTMADTVPVLIWIADTTKACTYFNKSWLDFTGRSLKSQLGHGWARGVHSDDYERCTRIYAAAFDKRQPFQIEYRLRHRSGKYRWVLDNGTPRYSADGKFTGYIGSCIDIEDFKRETEQRKELEAHAAALSHSNAELIALNTAKDEFISLASHQLRTPATGVKQYIGMLLEGYTDALTPDQLFLLQTAYQSNERQLKIVNDLLKVARVDAERVILRKRKTNLAVLMQGVIDEQQPEITTRHQRVKFTKPHAVVEARVDPDRLRMVLENLLDNASKYSPEGKVLRIRLGQTPSEITISVRDEGVGIAQKDMGKLFQKFSRINNILSTEGGGTGLGLYWAKKIIDLHEGTISVTSKQREGTTFTVTLPKG